jgi:hypothetical protein
MEPTSAEVCHNVNGSPDRRELSSTMANERLCGNQQESVIIPHGRMKSADGSTEHLR